MHNIESSQLVPLTRPTPKAPDLQEDPTLRRLLLCEILLEEYECLDQPPMDQAQLNLVKGAITEYRSMYDVMEEPQREVSEAAFNGEMAGRIYRMMTKAQAASLAELRSVYEDAYRERIPDAASREKVVDQAVLANLLGEIEALRQTLTKEDANVESDEQRQKIIEHEILEAIASRAESVTDSSPSGNGNGASLTPIVSQAERQIISGATLRSALCLSGGGIRSATFNLGILQALARHGLLDKFDYLSTVSGGGFIGGWLSAWICRNGLDVVNKALSEPPRSALTPDPAPVEHLRIYSNYLSPQPGLLSADTWTLITSLIRNLLLNWLVFVPVLIAALFLPRISASIVFRGTIPTQRALLLSLGVGFVSSVWALSYIARRLPSVNNYFSNPRAKRFKGGQGPFIARCLIWLVISAAALSVALWKYFQLGGQISWRTSVAFTESMMIIPWAICIGKIISITKPKKRGNRFYSVLVGATLLLLFAQGVIAYIASYVIRSVLFAVHPNQMLYAIFSVPVILLLMGLGSMLITGFTSRFTNDDDQEWWARAGAWLLIVTVAWSLVHALVLYGPLLLLTLQDTYTHLAAGGLKKLEWADVAKLAGTLTGIVSGIITIIGGFSSKTPANSREARKSGLGGMALAVLIGLVAPIFLGFLIILLSLGTDWLLISWPAQFLSSQITGNVLPYLHDPLKDWHLSLIEETPFRVLLILSFVMLVIGVAMGRLINTNAFSLQYLWRNRIIRAYLGASHTDRRPDPFTGFDSYDNLQMHELRPQPTNGTERVRLREGRPADDKLPGVRTRKLFHILNLALNLTGGEKLQWQDRKAESFTVSPLHAGSYWLGYRRSYRYGGNEGISLGAAIAISGAFVSPNMGYMMTSSVVRFLMALFNVRFGWWLGNPGPAGDETNIFERLLNVPARLLGFEVPRPFRLRSPRLSVIPFIAEAFGQTDDKSPYVYLSDGGHFENLGLYEMVLRRCRFIVVSDATTDPDYSFQSLAMAIRQIRVDLGVPIDLPELAVGRPSQDLRSKYCAIGTIRYSCVDRNPADQNTKDEDFDGILILIKPSLIGEEPRDVINYWQGRSSFPQEIITDQWFTEEQFECYRALGSAIVDAICEGKQNKITLAGLVKKVREHNRLNFRAFQERLSYFALEQEFKESMQQQPVGSYRSKVRKFMDSLLG